MSNFSKLKHISSLTCLIMLSCSLIVPLENEDEYRLGYSIFPDAGTIGTEFIITIETFFIDKNNVMRVKKTRYPILQDIILGGILIVMENLTPNGKSLLQHNTNSIPRVTSILYPKLERRYKRQFAIHCCCRFCR